MSSSYKSPPPDLASPVPGTQPPAFDLPPGREALSPVRPSPIQIALFLATVLSTLFVGALHEGADPIARPATLWRGIPFAVTLLSILFVHEMGHYITARRSGVEVTLPYFIPAPTLLGTFGAFIRMRPPIRDRGSLLMIGAAGPIAGFLVALPAVWIGVATSHLAAVPDAAIQLGDSLVMRAAVAIIHGPIPAGQDLLLNSVGLAAWAGILVTALNLLPIGQLDGGHVAYALFGRAAVWIGLGAIAAMLMLARAWPGWIAWCVLPIVFGLKHPAPADPERPLELRHRLVGLVALIVFAVCFIPVPLRLNP
jgi:membrane-associated protease RseP (regulator of RpoE activity)